MNSPPGTLLAMPNPKEPSTVFGARLVAARRARAMTQTQLAEKVGTTQKSISYYEAAGGQPTGELVSKLAQVLGTTSDYLLGLSDSASDSVEPSRSQSGDERRLWRRFRQLVNLPEKDRRAVLRMLDTMAKAQELAKAS